MSKQIGEHEDLLLKIQAAEKTALRLAQSGNRISNVIQRLRDAGKEIQTRIKYFTREAQATAKPAAPKADKPQKPPKGNSSSPETPAAAN